MLEGPLTKDELTEEFTRRLKSAREGGLPVPSDSGMERQTIDAIDDVAKAFPKASVSLVNTAKREFALELERMKGDVLH